jgi:glucose/arabinose dehydrogenase
MQCDMFHIDGAHAGGGPALDWANVRRVIRADGSSRETYASGIRNSVGLAFDPAYGELWFTDNGRDWLGDDLPSCELNHATAQGQHFGYPYVHGLATADPEFAAQAPERVFTPPALELGAHVAPLGLMFYTGAQFPPAFRRSLLVAEHGSWNRSRKSGYRVMQIRLDERGKVLGQSPWVTGWLEGERAWGRPVDLLQMPDGAVLIADDTAGVIYRVSYSPKP